MKELLGDATGKLYAQFAAQKVERNDGELDDDAGHPPDDIPHSKPSSTASDRAISTASLLVTFSTCVGDGEVGWGVRLPPTSEHHELHTTVPGY